MSVPQMRKAWHYWIQRDAALALRKHAPHCDVCRGWFDELFVFPCGALCLSCWGWARSYLRDII